MRELVYYFKHLDKCLKTIIPNARFASWFKKKITKKAFNLLLHSGDAHFVFIQYNTVLEGHFHLGVWFWIPGFLNRTLKKNQFSLLGDIINSCRLYIGTFALKNLFNAKVTMYSLHNST
jgi:hypothetical protein